MRAALGLLVLAGGLAGCSDPCGPGDAPADGLVLAAVDDVALTTRIAGLIAGANNDCPAADAPAGVVSLTIAGASLEGSRPFTWCVPRPDLLASGAIDLADARFFDAGATLDGCTLSLPAAPAATGTVTSTGMCGNGADGAGFALTFAGELTLARDCGGTVDDVRVTLTGTVAVAGP